MNRFRSNWANEDAHLHRYQSTKDSSKELIWSLEYGATISGGWGQFQMKLVTAQTSAPQWLMRQDVETRRWKQAEHWALSTILRIEGVKLNYSEQKKSKISRTHTGIVNTVFSKESWTCSKKPVGLVEKKSILPNLQWQRKHICNSRGRKV